MMIRIVWIRIGIIGVGGSGSPEGWNAGGAGGKAPVSGPGSESRPPR
ncbi:MAG: hypothetical protein LBU00_07305 [Treponema sp.]|nr:hypothetical protein [Treponema sp.]